MGTSVQSLATMLDFELDKDTGGATVISPKRDSFGVTMDAGKLQHLQTYPANKSYVSPDRMQAKETSLLSKLDSIRDRSSGGAGSSSWDTSNDAEKILLNDGKDPVMYAWPESKFNTSKGTRMDVFDMQRSSNRAPDKVDRVPGKVDRDLYRWPKTVPTIQSNIDTDAIHLLSKLNKDDREIGRDLTNPRSHSPYSEAWGSHVKKQGPRSRKDKTTSTKSTYQPFTIGHSINKISGEPEKHVPSDTYRRDDYLVERYSVAKAYLKNGIRANNKYLNRGADPNKMYLHLDKAKRESYLQNISTKDLYRSPEDDSTRDTYTQSKRSFSSDRILNKGRSFSSDRMINKGRSFSSDRIPNKGRSFSSDRIINRGRSFSTDRIPNKGRSFSSDRLINRGRSASKNRRPSYDNIDDIKREFNQRHRDNIPRRDNDRRYDGTLSKYVDGIDKDNDNRSILATREMPKHFYKDTSHNAHKDAEDVYARDIEAIGGGKHYSVHFDPKIDYTYPHYDAPSSGHNSEADVSDVLSLKGDNKINPNPYSGRVSPRVLPNPSRYSDKQVNRYYDTSNIGCPNKHVYDPTSKLHDIADKMNDKLFRKLYPDSYVNRSYNTSNLDNPTKHPTPSTKLHDLSNKSDDKSIQKSYLDSHADTYNIDSMKNSYTPTIKLHDTPDKLYDDPVTRLYRSNISNRDALRDRLTPDVFKHRRTNETNDTKLYNPANLMNKYDLEVPATKDSSIVKPRLDSFKHEIVGATIQYVPNSLKYSKYVDAYKRKQSPNKYKFGNFNLFDNTPPIGNVDEMHDFVKHGDTLENRNNSSPDSYPSLPYNRGRDESYLSRPITMEHEYNHVDPGMKHTFYNDDSEMGRTNDIPLFDVNNTLVSTHSQDNTGYYHIHNSI